MNTKDFYLADKQINIKIENQWAWDDQDHYNGCLMVSTVAFAIFKQL